MSITQRKPTLVTYGLILANLIVLLLEFFSGSDLLDPLVALEWGANFAPLTLGQDWWRLITSMFVHYGIFHFLANMFSLYQIGRSLEKNLGPIYLLAIYFITGIFAGLVSLYWNLFVFSAGASGALFGLFGFEVVYELIMSKADPARIRFILINFFIYISIILFLGSQLPFDNAAHIGGLIAGAILAPVYLFIRNKPIPFQGIGLSLALAIVILIYFELPRYQKTYFDLGQKSLFVEKRSNQILDGEYSTDALYIKEIKTITPSWDSVLWSLDSLKNVPEDLAEDKLKLKHYIKARRLELEYMIICFEKESYIYFDSLEVVREEMKNIEPTKYVFNLTPTVKDSTLETSEQRHRAVVKEYYDSTWRPTEVWNARYYRLGYKDSLNRWDGPVRDYYLNTSVQMKGAYEKDLRDGVFIYYSEDNQYESAGIYRDNRKVGKWEYFHDNGSLSQEMRYRDKSYMVNAWSADGIQQVKEGEGVIKEYHSNGILSRHEKYNEGLIDSISYGYHKNGAPYFKELYDKGELIQGVSYSLDKEVFNYDISTYIPQPVGGMTAFRKYEQQAKNEIRTLWRETPGRVELVFSLTEEGDVFDIIVLKGVNQQVDKIARQILSDGPKWIPGKLHGQEPIAIEGYIFIDFP